MNPLGEIIYIFARVGVAISSFVDRDEDQEQRITTPSFLIDGAETVFREASGDIEKARATFLSVCRDDTRMNEALTISAIQQVFYGDNAKVLMRELRGPEKMYKVHSRNAIADAKGRYDEACRLLRSKMEEDPTLLEKLRSIEVRRLLPG